MVGPSYLQFPEDAARVSVVVVSERDVLHAALAARQVALHVFEEPRFEVQADSVDLKSNQTCQGDEAIVTFFSLYCWL